MSGINKSVLSFPDFPTGVRFAEPDDIERIAIICTAGFYYSPIFKWERPHHDDYPEDTVLSYSQTFVDAMKNEASIVLVALDKYNPNENEKTSATIPDNNGWTPPVEGELVPVAVICLKLPPGSSHHGRFQDYDVLPTLPENPNRDLDERHYKSWGRISSDAKESFFGGYFIIEMLVTHPAYWNRRHASTLVKWCIELTNGGKLGVNAADTGKGVYERLGFGRVHDVVDPGTEDDQSEAKTTLYTYPPPKPNPTNL